MSMEYAERRIKEALRQAGGNVTRARQQIIAWTYEDAKLLHALAKPHLNGIVAYHVERVVSGRSEAANAPAPDTPQIAEEEEFGIEILKAVASTNAAIFGQEGHGGQAKRGRASKQHIDAIRQMASKSKPVKK